jgi:hypothetical protein
VLAAGSSLTISCIPCILKSILVKTLKGEFKVFCYCCYDDDYISHICWAVYHFSFYYYWMVQKCKVSMMLVQRVPRMKSLSCHGHGSLKLVMGL